MRDHDGCEDAILAAMRNDRPGKAEFLAARCDLARQIASDRTALYRPRVQVKPDGRWNVWFWSL